MKIISNLFRRKSSQTALSQLLEMSGNSDAGVNINAKNAMQITTVFNCVRVLSEGVGMLPLNIFKTTGNNKVKAESHRLHRLMVDGPNDYMTAQEFKELVVAHLAYRGNHYSWKNIVNGELRELLPLSPDSVKPKFSEGWSVAYDVTFPDGTTRELKEGEIFHVRLFTLDGLNGLSPIQQNKNSLGLARATEKHGSKLFVNAARPHGGFSTDSKLTDDQFKRLKNQFDNVSGDNQLKPLILEGGLKWLTVTMSNEDAQFLETRKYQRSEICGIFRVPPHMVGDLENATFSNIEHQGLSFVQHSLMPYLTRIESRISKSLIKPSERRNLQPKFNANALLRGDMAARAEFYTKMVQNGALSPNEIRELEDRNPREGGDIFLTPLNMAINGKPQGE